VPAYAFYGQGGADRELPLQALDRLPTGVQAVHLGSIASVVEPIAQTLREAVRRLHDRCVIAYDPNVRPTVEPDAAVWRRQLAQLLPKTDTLKLSSEDLDHLAPGAAPEAFARHALDQGVAVVLLTQGSQGERAWTRRQAVAVAAPPVSVVDTVGAGDTVQAAWLAWLAEQGLLARATLHALDEPALQAGLQFAKRAGALTCSRRGADLPRRGEIG